MALLIAIALRGARVLRTGRWPIWLLVFAFAGPLGIKMPEAAAAPAVSREYQVKAVFLYNFIQFVRWPSDAFNAEDSAIRIGVLGDDPFGPALEQAVRDEIIRNRRLVVHRAQQLEDLRGCHLVFISKSESRRLDSLLAALGSHPVLTVSEIDGFARRGGIIGFYSDGSKVRFEINAGAAKRSNLDLSSELLSLGRIVGSESFDRGGL